MASQTDSTQLQSEAASGFLALSQDIKSAQQLLGSLQVSPLQPISQQDLSPRGTSSGTSSDASGGVAFAALRMLIQAEHFSIAYPAARSLSCLACFPEAQQHFLDHSPMDQGFAEQGHKQSLVLLMLEKMRHQATCPLVRDQLAQATKCSISHGIGSLSRELVEELSTALQEALQNPELDEKSSAFRDIQQALQESAGALRLHALALQPEQEYCYP